MFRCRPKYQPTTLRRARFAGHNRGSSYRARDYKDSTVDERCNALLKIRDQIDREVLRMKQDQADEIGARAWMTGMEAFVQHLERRP